MRMSRICLLAMSAVVTLGCALQLSASQWSKVADMQTGRQEIYSAVSDGKIYVPGGVLNSGGTSASLEAYDSEKNVWQELAPMPEARHHITPAIIDNQLFAIGGFNGHFPEWTLKPDMFVYDIEKNSWTSGSPLPIAQGEHVTAVVNNRIHVIGGRVPRAGEGGHFDSYYDSAIHHIYNPDTMEWTRGKEAPTARNSAAAAVIDGLIYVVGGRQNLVQEDGTQLQHNMGTLEVYDPSTDSWKTLTPMPEGLGGTAAATVDGKLYVFGGEQWTPSHEVFDSAWVYDPATDSWKRLPSMLVGRHGLAAAAVDGVLYTFGGCTVVGGGAVVRTTEAIRP